VTAARFVSIRRTDLKIYSSCPHHVSVIATVATIIAIRPRIFVLRMVGNGGEAISASLAHRNKSLA